jgi:hypothetical protein
MDSSTQQRVMLAEGRQRREKEKGDEFRIVPAADMIDWERSFRCRRISRAPSIPPWSVRRGENRRAYWKRQCTSQCAGGRTPYCGACSPISIASLCSSVPFAYLFPLYPAITLPINPTTTPITSIVAALSECNSRARVWHVATTSLGAHKA